MAKLSLSGLNALWVDGYIPTETDYQDLFSSLRQDAERINTGGPYELDLQRVNRLIEIYGTTAITLKLNSGLEGGDSFFIKNNSTQVATIDRNGQTLDLGAVNLSLAPGSAMLIVYTGSGFIAHYVGGGIFVLSTNKADATAVSLDNSNRFTSYEVTGGFSPAFSLTSGTAQGSAWRIKNSNPYETTVVSLLENGMITDFGGDLKLKPGETVDIFHQGSDRFILRIQDAPVEVYTLIARTTGGNPATWSLLNDGGGGAGGDHVLEAPAGITPAISVVAAATNYLRLDLGDVNGNKILGAVISGDEILRGIHFGHQINQDTKHYLAINFRDARQRMLDVYFTWGGSSYSQSQAEGDFMGTLSVNSASQINVIAPATEDAGLYSPYVNNSSFTYFAKPGNSINNNLTINMRQYDGVSTPVPGASERVFATKRYHGVGTGSGVDADNIPGATSTSNLWIFVRMQRSRF